jgi:heptosyltransferase-3
MIKKSFLICHPGALGDFLLTWPALAALRKRLPHHEFIGIGRYPYLELAKRWKLLDTLHDTEARYLTNLFSGKNLPPELGQPDGAILWLADSPEIVEILKITATLPVLTLNPKPEIQYHLSQYYLKQIQYYYSIHISQKTITSQFSMIRHNPEWILIHPGSGNPQKNFSPSFYKSLIALFLKKGFPKVGVILGPVEIDMGLQSTFSDTITVISKNLDELLKLLSSCSLYIGNDSGASHLAGILGIPTIAFYIKTDPAVWGVMGKEVHLISEVSETKAFTAFKRYIANREFPRFK